jgi:hypothetical protein
MKHPILANETAKAGISRFERQRESAFPASNRDCLKRPPADFQGLSNRRDGGLIPGYRYPTSRM